MKVPKSPKLKKSQAIHSPPTPKPLSALECASNFRRAGCFVKIVHSIEDDPLSSKTPTQDLVDREHLDR